MMTFIRENRAFAIILGVVVFLGFLYLLFGRGDSQGNDSLLSSAGASPTSAVSRDLLATLNALKSVRLDERIFTDPLFLSLKDFGVQIPLQPAGRENPFAPFGSTAAPSR